jgi:hypothetical protein
MRPNVTQKADDKDASAIGNDGKESGEEETPGKARSSDCQNGRRG